MKLREVERMSDENTIVQRVYEAKEDMLIADALISDYMPFIMAQVSNVMKRSVDVTKEDELSIAMIAFSVLCRFIDSKSNN